MLNKDQKIIYGFWSYCHIVILPLTHDYNRVLINLSVSRDVISRQLDVRWYMNHQADRPTPKCLAFVPGCWKWEGGASGTNLGQMKHMSLSNPPPPLFHGHHRWWVLMRGDSNNGISQWPQQPFVLQRKCCTVFRKGTL